MSLTACSNSSLPAGDGAVDMALADGGAVDGSPDQGSPDANIPDANVSDAPPPDASPSDGGAPDMLAADMGASDAGAADAGSMDGGAADAGSPGCRAAIAPQCAFSAAELTLCFEHTAGCPGDVVEMQIFALGPPDCDSIFQTTAGGQNLPTHTLLNPASQVVPTGDRCIRREVFREGLDWGVLPGSAVGVDACVEEVPVGLLDTVRFEIAADAAPDDYTWSDERGRVFSNDRGCGFEGVVMFPTFRVEARR